MGRAYLTLGSAVCVTFRESFLPFRIIADPSSSTINSRAPLQSDPHLLVSTWTSSTGVDARERPDDRDVGGISCISFVSSPHVSSSSSSRIAKHDGRDCVNTYEVTATVGRLRETVVKPSDGSKTVN